MSAGLIASIHARLLNKARERGEEFQSILVRFSLERLLYRPSMTSARDRLCLKGALLFNLWFQLRHRPTRDLDLLGFGPIEAGRLLERPSARSRSTSASATSSHLTRSPPSIHRCCPG